jgi:hypothetical protein
LSPLAQIREEMAVQDRLAQSREVKFFTQEAAAEAQDITMQMPEQVGRRAVQVVEEVGVELQLLLEQLVLQTQVEAGEVVEAGLLHQPQADQAL